MFFCGFMSQNRSKNVLYTEMKKETFQDEARRLRPRLTALARRYTDDADDAEDIVQDALLKLWLMHDDLQSPPDGLAMVLTRNLSIDHQRRKKLPILTPEMVETAYEEDERIERMMRVIDTLPGMQQIVLRLRHLEGMEYRDIAHITGTTETAVRKTLSRARKAVAERINKRKYDDKDRR